MAIQILMPKIGLTMSEGKVVEWKKGRENGLKKERFSSSLKQKR
jgi:hypothetical protein